MRIDLQLTSYLFFLTLIALKSTTTILAQAPASAPPPSSGPDNITAILEKAGQYNTMIRLLKSTQIADQINNQLNNSNQGITLFAPTDNAFSNLSPGTLNSLTDQQKVSLIQFHILPSLVSVSQFQTVSNPVRTQAGNGNGQYPLNVTSAGNQVNISTGLVNTTVANTVYTDSQIAVYQVDKVLLPVDIFRPSVPAPSPAPSTKKAKRASSSSDGPSSSDDASADKSGAYKKKKRVAVALAVGAFAISLLSVIDL